jgi:putative ABC transport system permease protein
MLRNYLVTALRNIARYKLHSFVNIAGLTVGLACAIFIVLFVRDELSYDRWIAEGQNVYRVETNWNWPGGTPYDSAYAPFPLAVAMIDQIPEIADAVRLVPEEMTVKIDDRQFPETVSFVDPGFFSLVHLPLLRGEATSVLSGPESAVLSERMAHKYFGDADPVGKTLIVGGTSLLTVTGVLRNPPHNSGFQSEIYVSNKSTADAYSGKKRWFDGSTYLYSRLSPGAEPTLVTRKIQDVLRRNADPGSIIQTRISGDQLIQARLVPLADMHLVGVETGNNQAGSWTTIYGFATIAVLILAIACLNFTNLATARATTREREVSLRKVMGAQRRQLIGQFLGESVLTALIALLLALAVVEMLMAPFDSLLDAPITFDYLADWPLLLGMVGVAAAAGLLAGLYPAFILSAFRPAATLRIRTQGQTGSGLLRTGLVIAQFAISIGLGIVVLVVFGQIRYARQIDLGFDRDNMVVLEGVDALPAANVKSLEQRLSSSSDIAGVARSSAVPFSGPWQGTSAQVSGGLQNGSTRIISAEPGFFDVYGMRLLSGRLLSADRGEDLMDGVKDSNEVKAGGSILINAEEARKLGLTPEQAVETTVLVGTRRSPARVVGVVSDAKFFGARDAVDPIIFADKPNATNVISVRVKGGHAPSALAFIDKSWAEFAPTVALRRHFLDDSFDKLFGTTERQGAMLGLFVGIAIFVACLGLFGLAAFTAQRRTKEICIRKVCGARTSDIVRLLLWHFSIPVLIANLIAWPAAWLYLRGWLDGYAYRIALSPVYFLAAGAIALFIAWTTVLPHALRVARANPARAFHHE